MNYKKNCSGIPLHKNHFSRINKKYQTSRKTKMSMPPTKLSRLSNKKDAFSKNKMLTKAIDSISSGTSSITPITNHSMNYSSSEGSDLFFHRNFRTNSSSIKLPFRGSQALRKKPSLLEGISPYCYQMNEDPFNYSDTSRIKLFSDQSNFKSSLSSIQKKGLHPKNKKDGQESNKKISRSDICRPIPYESFLIPKNPLTI